MRMLSKVLRIHKLPVHGESVVLTLHVHRGPVRHQGNVGPDHVQREILRHQDPAVLSLEVEGWMLVFHWSESSNSGDVENIVC